MLPGLSGTCLEQHRVMAPLRQVHLACEQVFMAYRPASYAGPALLHATRWDERESIRCPCGVAWRR
jgi:hypothetical protein